MNSAQAILDHILESDFGDEDLVKDVTSHHQFDWLARYGFVPFKQPQWGTETWTKRVMRSSGDTYIEVTVTVVPSTQAWRAVDVHVWDQWATSLGKYPVKDWQNAEELQQTLIQVGRTHEAPVLESLEDEDDLVKEVGGGDPLNWLKLQGFQHKIDRTGWWKEIPGYFILVQIYGRHAYVRAYDESSTELRRVFVPKLDLDTLAWAIQEIQDFVDTKLIESVNNEDPGEFKDIGLPSLDPDAEILALERCLDELTTHGTGDKQLTLPFSLIIHWLNTPAADRVMGWDWPTLRKEIETVYIPALKYAGMEIQADDLKHAVDALNQFKGGTV